VAAYLETGRVARIGAHELKAVDDGSVGEHVVVASREQVEVPATTAEDAGDAVDASDVVDDLDVGQGERGGGHVRSWAPEGRRFPRRVRSGDADGCGGAWSLDQRHMALETRARSTWRQLMSMSMV
jgi:hypothetical protein